jgi:integrase
VSKLGRISKTNTGKWAYDVDLGPTAADRGRVIRANFATRKEASQALEEIKRTSHQVRSQSLRKVDAYMSGWVSERFETGRIRESTARGYTSIINLVASWFGDMPLDSLSAIDLDAFYRHLQSTGGRYGIGRSPATVHQFHRIIKTALGDATKKGLIDRNAALSADPPKMMTKVLDVDDLWEPHEIVAFLDSPWLPENRRILYSVAFGTGFRAGELAGLYWTDFEDDTLSVRRSRTNGFKGRVYEGYPKSSNAIRSVGLHSVVADQLCLWQEVQADQMLVKGLGPQYVFTNARLGPWNPNGITKNWISDARRAVKEGIVSKYANLHMVRHWYGTHLFVVGTDLPTVKALMGHHSASFTVDRYVHGDRRRSEEASRRVGGMLWGDD